MKTLVINHASGRPLDFAAVEKPFVTPAALADRIAPSYCSRPAQSSALALADRLARDPGTSYWLAQQLRTMLRTFDPVDAVNDAELLLSVLSARLEEIQGGAK
jgi:hypothetical protein